MKELRVSSTTFHNTGALPDRCAAADEALSPAITWESAAGATAYAVVFRQIDEQGHDGPILWAVYNIPTNCSGFQEGDSESTTLPTLVDDLDIASRYHGLRSDRVLTHYKLTVSALSAHIDIGPDARGPELSSKINSLSLAEGVIRGYYTPPLAPGKLLFSGQRRLGAFFTQTPRRIAASLSLAALVLLVLPAWFLDVFSIPGTVANQGANDTGFWWEINWAFLFLVVIPVFFALAGRFACAFHLAVVELSGRRLGVFRSSHSGQAAGLALADAIAKALTARKHAIFWGCLAAAIAMTVVDT